MATTQKHMNAILCAHYSRSLPAVAKPWEMVTSIEPIEPVDIVWSSFVFANKNCNWLKYITWFTSANSNFCLQNQMNIELHVERLFWESKLKTAIFFSTLLGILGASSTGQYNVAVMFAATLIGPPHYRETPLSPTAVRVIAVGFEIIFQFNIIVYRITI